MFANFAYTSLRNTSFVILLIIYSKQSSSFAICLLSNYLFPKPLYYLINIRIIVSIIFLVTHPVPFHTVSIILSNTRRIKLFSKYFIIPKHLFYIQEQECPSRPPYWIFCFYTVRCQVFVSIFFLSYINSLILFHIMWLNHLFCHLWV